MTTTHSPPVLADQPPGTAFSAGRGRLLAAGRSADVFEWEGVPSTPDPDRREARVIKVHRGADARRLALAEAAALSSLDHPHVVRLCDLHDDGSTVGIILPRLSIESAADWLRSRRIVTAGEAVTLLVPLLRVLLHIERRGLDPRVRLAAAISLDDVLFDDRGAPVVTSLRAAPTAGLARLLTAQPSPSEVGRRLVTEVLALTVGGSAEGRRDLARLLRAEQPGADVPVPAQSVPAQSVPAQSVSAQPVPAESMPIDPGVGADLDELIELVFSLDNPAALEPPLPIASVDDDLDGFCDPRTFSAPGVPVTPETRSPANERPVPVSPHLFDDLVPGVRALRESLAVSPGLQRLVAALREVRPRVWITTGVVLLSTGVAASMLTRSPDSPLPATTQSPRSEPENAGSESPGSENAASEDATSESSGSEVLRSDAREAESSRPESAAPSSETSEPDSTIALLKGDDAPMAAARLLELRAACLHELDASCLHGVDQPDSPALKSDLAAVNDPDLTAGLPASPTLGSEVNRFGGSVLFEARTADDEPASVLVVRTEAGWRLRDVRR